MTIKNDIEIEIQIEKKIELKKIELKKIENYVEIFHNQNVQLSIRNVLLS